jgi:hypothetical protein
MRPALVPADPSHGLHAPGEGEAVLMGTLKIKLDCQVSGPLGDGTAIKAAEQWAERTSQALADEGVAMLRAFPMDKTGRARGGFQGALKTVRRSPTEVRIPGPQQRGVAWSPWLEGGSKRNSSTGFKGYHLFRKTRLALSKEAPQIGQKELDKLMAEMGGE